MAGSALLIADITHLQLKIHSYGKQEARNKLTTLNGYSQRSLSRPKVIMAYHDSLLFLKAYPDNAAVLKIVSAELGRIKDVVTKIMGSNNRSFQRSLSGTGIAGTSLTAQFSLPVTQWLLEKFPQSISFFEAAGKDEACAPFLQQLFPAIEYFHTTQRKMLFNERLLQLTGNKQPLRILLSAFSKNIPGKILQESIFDSFSIFIQWQLDQFPFSRTSLTGVSHPVFFHKKIVKQVNSKRVSKKGGPMAMNLSFQQKTILLDTARASLAFYFRETEPITQGISENVQLFNCGRGLMVALYGMNPERKLSIESYIGYMVFKNTVPVAYGGGWIFGDRCKIGLNIFPPFRKGESAFLFSEVLRIFRQRYKMERFIIKPYQFGKGNTEGLKSAAFWFYYKLGFRPTDKKMAAVAAFEWQEKRKSSVSLLKYFTHADLELTYSPLLPKDLDPENISRMITRHIIQQFDGDRERALSNAVGMIKENLKVSKTTLKSENITQFCLLLSLLPGIRLWSSSEKKQLIDIIHSRTGKEETYILKVQKCHKLINELFRIMNLAKRL